MSEVPTPRRGKRGSAREARRAARAKPQIEAIPYITRNIPTYDILGDEGLSIIEANAETILEEVGIEFRDDEDGMGTLQVPYSLGEAGVGGSAQLAAYSMG